METKTNFFALLILFFLGIKIPLAYSGYTNPVPGNCGDAAVENDDTPAKVQTLVFNIPPGSGDKLYHLFSNHHFVPDYVQLYMNGSPYGPGFWIGAGGLYQIVCTELTSPIVFDLKNSNPQDFPGTTQDKCIRGPVRWENDINTGKITLTPLTQAQIINYFVPDYVGTSSVINKVTLNPENGSGAIYMKISVPEDVCQLAVEVRGNKSNRTDYEMQLICPNGKCPESLPDNTKFIKATTCDKHTVGIEHACSNLTSTGTTWTQIFPDGTLSNDPHHATMFTEANPAHSQQINYLLDVIYNGLYFVGNSDTSSCEVQQVVPVDVWGKISTLRKKVNPATCLSPDSASLVVEGVDGGTPPYSLSLSGPNSYQSSIANFTNASSDWSITSLLGGLYNLTVIDANECVLSETVDLGQIDPFKLEFSSKNVTCHGASNGSASAQPVTLTPGNFMFEWKNSAGKLISSGVQQSSVSGLEPGSYSVKVTNAKGCSEVKNFSITQPNALQVDSSVNDYYCDPQDGGVNLTVLGGVPPYQVESGNATTLLDAPGETVYFSGAEVGATTTTTTVIDKNGCQLVEPTTFNATPLEMDGVVTVNGCKAVVNLTIYKQGDPTKAPVRTATKVFDINELLSKNQFEVSESYGGCTMTKTFDVPKPLQIFVPNIFSPNEDGINDEFTVSSSQNQTFSSAKVFDRWGSAVSEVNGGVITPKGISIWNGRVGNRDAQPGVYVYLIQLDESSCKRLIKGDITLK